MGPLTYFLKLWRHTTCRTHTHFLERVVPISLWLCVPVLWYAAYVDWPNLRLLASAALVTAAAYASGFWMIQHFENHRPPIL